MSEKIPLSDTDFPQKITGNVYSFDRAQTKKQAENALGHSEKLEKELKTRILDRHRKIKLGWMLEICNLLDSFKRKSHEKIWRDLSVNQTWFITKKWVDDIHKVLHLLCTKYWSDEEIPTHKIIDLFKRIITEKKYDESLFALVENLEK